MHGDDNWKQAARDYHAARGDRRAVVEIDRKRLKRLRQLLDDKVGIDRAYWQINDDAKNGAAQATVEALMFSLRQRGVAALNEPGTRRRLNQLSDDQVIEIERRLQALKIGHCWTADEVETLVRLREELRDDD